MSVPLRAVLSRSNDDMEFRSGILEGDLSGLKEYDLTAEEVEALKSGDENVIYRLLGDTKYFHLREQGNYGDSGV